MKRIANTKLVLSVIVAIFFGIPVIFNFFIFKPISGLSVGKLEYWMSFWGSYLGATISSMTAFIILYIQRKDHERDLLNAHMDRYKQSRSDYWRNYQLSTGGTNEESKKLQNQLNILSYNYEMKWLKELREAFSAYICAYDKKSIEDIIRSTCLLSFETTQQLIRSLHDNITHADIALCLVVKENHNAKVELDKIRELTNQYKSIIQDIQSLVCVYYIDTTKKDFPTDILYNGASDKMKRLLGTERESGKQLNYGRFSVLAHQLMRPLSERADTVQVLANKYISDEQTRIETK